MTVSPQPTLLLLSTLMVSSQAFQAATTFHKHTLSPLNALIYGWDGPAEEIDTASSYLDITNDPFGSKACSPLGTAVAEALSYDRDRAGHLARLAVAFSPPGQALTLDQIEKVDVLCVHDESIDIQAVLCEDHGCVSLSVPIQFPKSCYSNSPELEGCVIQNLEALDATAGTLLQKQNQLAHANNAEQQLGGGGDFHAPFQAFPSWWVPPEYQPHLLTDCQTVQNLLNEDEFQPDVTALAQDALKRTAECEAYKVLQARVARVGPAGICFKVLAQDETGTTRATAAAASAAAAPVRILEVVHPFDRTMTDVESLRAAVLGAVASAVGN